MRSVKSKNTGPERALARALTRLGVKFVRHAQLPGSPDFALPQARLAVFVHGCFWHCCARHFSAPKSRAAAWARHFAKNRARDLRVRRLLRLRLWRTMVVWEHEAACTAAARVRRRAESWR
jgi:DNA mismatch endonuclease (patch repair protein)